MKNKYFVSCIIPGVKRLGVIQFEAIEEEVMRKAMAMCPEPAEFKAYLVEEFEDIPINKFIPYSQLKELY